LKRRFEIRQDLHFGMGLSATHIGSEARRDRLLMLLAIAHALLTLLGAASERSGLDAYLKVNTVKRRTHSLFRQGSYWYQCLPTMRRDWLERLMSAFVEVLAVVSSHNTAIYRKKRGALEVIFLVLECDTPELALVLIPVQLGDGLCQPVQRAAGDGPVAVTLEVRSRSRIVGASSHRHQQGTPSRLRPRSGIT
jgi:hypothetical protein